MQTKTWNRTASVRVTYQERVPAKLNAFFSQECPACGRQVRVRFEHLDRQIGCRHCGCQLTASDGVSPEATPSATDAMMQRANQLLARYDCSGQHHPDDETESRVIELSLAQR